MDHLFTLGDKLMESNCIRLGVPIPRRYTDEELAEAHIYLKDAEEDFEAEELREGSRRDRAEDLERARDFPLGPL